MKRLTVIMISVFLVLSFSACGKDINKITDFSRFKDMTEIADRVEVVYDNNTGVPYYFSVVDQGELSVLMDIILSTQLEYAGTSPMAGDNTSLTVYQDGQQYSFHFRVNKEGDRYYSFAQPGLQNKIREYYSGINAENVKELVDNSDGYDLSCAYEVFFEDESYIYEFSSVKSQYVEVVYENGTAVNISHALQSGHITIAELDKYHIEYEKNAK